jgi:acetyltransferase-like isoleucine patch superfamily enzyme
MTGFLRRASFDALLYLTNRFVSRLPSHGLRQWYYRRVMGYVIGPGSFIFMDAWFDGKRSFRMGRNSVVNQKCRLDNRGGITIGDSVSISSEVCILTADHDVNSPDFAGRERPVVIEDYVFVGTRALILPGVTLGRGAVVAAGAVVTRSVAPYDVVAGVPAKVIASRRTDLEYGCSYGRLFH